MKQSVAFVFVILNACAVIACGTAAIGEVIRPTETQSANATLGVKPQSCVGDPQPAKPFVVDVDADTRVELEAAMQAGVAVVGWDCTSLKVLSGCSVADSGYGYAGVSRKEQVVQMSNLDDLHANLPIDAAKLGAEVTAGRSIDLALVFVGRRSSPTVKLAREELSGECDGATHFVRSATLGAFAMGTGSIGKVAAVAELFSYGGGASSTSERKGLTKDGDLENCRTSSHKATEPPDECRSAVRIELVPLAVPAVAAIKLQKPKAGDNGDKDGDDGKGKDGDDDGDDGKGKGKDDKEVKDAENPCPKGFQYVEGLCSRASTGPRLCDAKQPEECKTQCERGSAESCLTAGNATARKKGGDGTALIWYKKSCDGGFAEGCTALGDTMMRISEDTAPDYKEQVEAAVAVLQKGCDMGSADACESVGEIKTDKDYKVYDLKAGIEALDRSCTLGDGLGCYTLASMYFTGKQVPKDTAKGLSLFTKSCLGGDADQCTSLGETYEAGKRGVAVDQNAATKWFIKGCRIDPQQCSNASRVMTKAGKDTEAYAFAERGCADDELFACLLVADAKAAGKGTPKDQKGATALWTRWCEGGDGDEDACGHIGVKMKD